MPVFWPFIRRSIWRSFNGRVVDAAGIVAMIASLMVTPAMHTSRSLLRFWPLGPIFSMELRQIARRRRTYVLRFGYLGLMLAVLAMAWAAEDSGSRYRTQSLVSQAQQRAELGHVFLMVFSLFSIVAMHLIGPVLTSTAVGAERLRRTLDALLMTPLSAWQIAGGKLFSRTLTAFTLIGLTLPVLAIVRLLGGVEWQDLFGSVALAAATALASAAIGLLLSCFLRRAFAVILLAFLIEAVFYFFLPVLGSIFFATTVRGGSQGSYVTFFQVLAALNPALTAGARAGQGRGPLIEWWPAIAVQIGLAFALLLLATRVIRRESRQIHSAPAPLLGLGMGQGFSTDAADVPAENTFDASTHSGGFHSNLSRKENEDKPRLLISDNPVLWRESRLPMLARRWQRLFACVVTLGLLGLSYIVFGVADALKERELQIAYAFTMTALVMLIAIVLAATAIATEKESDTWTTLIASPLSGGAIVWGKFRGILRRLRWPLILMAGHFAVFTIAGVIDFGSFVVIMTTASLFYFPWIATGLYFSLRCTRPTTAVVLNLLVPGVIYAIIPFGLAALESTLPPPSRPQSPEITLYCLPFYYQAIAIDRLARLTGYSGKFELPMRAGTLPNYCIVPLTLLAGGGLVAITAVMLALLARRFDHIVGRAKSTALFDA